MASPRMYGKKKEIVKDNRITAAMKYKSFTEK